MFRCRSTAGECATEFPGKYAFEPLTGLEDSRVGWSLGKTLMGAKEFAFDVQKTAFTREFIDE